MKRLYTHIICLILFTTVLIQAIHAQNYLEFENEVTEWGTKQARDSILLKNGFEANPTGSQFLELTLGLTTIQPTSYLSEAPDPNTRELDKTREVGSIQGNFNVTPTGAATYSIPIKVPKGTGSMMPGLSVVYNSFVDNGEFGSCCFLSGISKIERIRNDYYHSATFLDPVDFDENDNYMWDGKFLVYKREENGNKIFNTEQNEFARIEAIGTSGNGPEKWHIITKNGMEYFFGYSDDSRHEVQEQTPNSPSVIRWMITKIKDPFTNTISYSYEESRETGEFWVSRIDYAMNETAGTSASNYVTFDYSYRSDPQKTFVGGSEVNNHMVIDKIRSYSNDKLFSEYLFRYIYEDYETRLVKVEQVGAYGEKYNSTILHWDDNDSGSSYVSDCFSGSPPDRYIDSNGDIYWGESVSGDFNGDGIDDSFWYYSDPSTGRLMHCSLYEPNGDYFIKVYDDHFSQWSHYYAQYFAGDIDGDGRDDLYWLYEANEMMYVNALISYNSENGTSFSWYDLGDYIPFCWPVDYNDEFQCCVSDCNKNGIDDWILSYKSLQDNNTWAHSVVSSELEFDNNGAIVSKSLLNWFSQYNSDVRPEIELFDFDGDGGSEFVTYIEGDGNCEVFKYPYDANNGSEKIYNDLYPTLDHNSFWGDFNGDGLADVLTNLDSDGSNTWELYLNKGYFGVTSGSTFDNVNYSPITRNANFDGVNSDYYIVCDANGDGFDDIIEIYKLTNNTQIAVNLYENHNLNFELKPFTISYDWNYLLSHSILEQDESLLKNTIWYGDYSGNNCIDLLIRHNSIGNIAILQFNEDQIYDVIDEIVNGLNQHIKIENSWGHLVDGLCTNPVKAEYPLVNDIGKRIMTSSVDIQIDDNNYITKNYLYRNGRTHLLGKGFLGFGEVVSENEKTTICEKIRYG
ncbi:MAG: SpvB/TcaC N-terminal domain-containing protein [Bacteroidales bacterium]|nr:SpvB/TcaC N-terminal domain-containing protein [Bacteroidales bacterium]